MDYSYTALVTREEYDFKRFVKGVKSAKVASCGCWLNVEQNPHSNSNIVMMK